MSWCPARAIFVVPSGYSGHLQRELLVLKTPARLPQIQCP